GQRAEARGDQYSRDGERDESLPHEVDQYSRDGERDESLPHEVDPRAVRHEADSTKGHLCTPEVARGAVAPVALRSQLLRGSAAGRNPAQAIGGPVGVRLKRRRRACARGISHVRKAVPARAGDGAKHGGRAAGWGDGPSGTIRLASIPAT